MKCFRCGSSTNSVYVIDVSELKRRAETKQFHKETKFGGARNKFWWARNKFWSKCTRATRWNSRLAEQCSANLLFHTTHVDTFISIIVKKFFDQSTKSGFRGIILGEMCLWPKLSDHFAVDAFALAQLGDNLEKGPFQNGHKGWIFAALKWPSVEKLASSPFYLP